MEYAGFFESCLLGVIAIRASYLYFLYTRVGELKVHLLLLYSSVLNSVQLGYLVMLLNQMKCSDYKIYWNVFVNIELLKCNEHQFMLMCEVLIHFRVAYVLPECWFISVPANFRRSICPILAMVIPDFSVNFGMTCARICRKYRVPRSCVLSILVVVFDRFSINVLTMNIGNVWRRKWFRYLQIR